MPIETEERRRPSRTELEAKRECARMLARFNAVLEGGREPSPGLTHRTLQAAAAVWLERGGGVMPPEIMGHQVFLRV